ncbi:MAG: EF-P lysine aminoacylase GenX [Kiritimatiellae bacterium]|nr:EF-P lysine aminoacylase GenX [Kiritimatiellia bacterium]
MPPPGLLQTLAKRAEIVRAVRAFFDAQGFIEVETPVLIAAPAPEEHIDCPAVRGADVRVEYLRASPELQMKKLLAAGMDRIYQLGPCFREGERGSRHNPEFTMLEWYRRGAGYLDIADDFARLLRAAAAAVGADDARFSAEAKRLTVREAYRTYAGWDPWKAFDADRFDVDMATKVEPAIGALGGGVFLMDYPVQAASLARVRGDVAERWEFYWDGLELANCFTELCDETEQAARFARAKAARQTLGEADYPIDGDFLACLPLIGSAAGVAVGIDRLVMALTGASTIALVRAGG